MHQVLQLFFWFLYLFFLMKYYGSIVIFPTFSVYFVSLVLSASPFSSKLVFFLNHTPFKIVTQILRNFKTMIIVVVSPCLN